MKTAVKLFRSLAMPALVLCSCGGADGGSNNSGGPGGGSGGPCSVTVTGDATSGVPSATWGCGWAKDLTTNVAPVEYVVNVQILGTTQTQAGILLVGPNASALPKADLSIVSETAITGPVSWTDQNPPPSNIYGLGAMYIGASNAVWATRNYALNITSAVPTATGDCASSVGPPSIYPTTSCYRVHGTMHAVLQPGTSLPNNVAKGSVTLDWTF